MTVEGHSHRWTDVDIWNVFNGFPFSSVFYISNRAAYPFQRFEVACEGAQPSAPSPHERRYLELSGKHEMHHQHQRIEIFYSELTRDPFPHG